MKTRRKFSKLEKSLFGTNIGAIVLIVLLTVTLVGAAATINVYLDDLPATTTYTIKTDGTNYWAVRYDGYKASEGTVAHTLINSIITTVSSAGGGVIYIQDGTYTTTGTIIPKNNVYLKLSPKAKIKATTPASLNAMFSLMKARVNDGDARVENFTVDGGIWDGNKGAFTDHRTSGTWAANFWKYMGIVFAMESGNIGKNIVVKNLVVQDIINSGVDLQMVQNGLVENVWVYRGGDNPITAVATTDTWNHSVTFRHNYVDGGYDVGINVWNGGYVTIEDNTVTNINGWGGASHWGIGIESAHDSTLKSNKVYMTTGMSSGIVVADPPSGSADNRNNLVLDNEVYGTGTLFPIEIKYELVEVAFNRFYKGGNSHFWGGTISHNQFYDSGVLQIFGETGTDNVTMIVDNLFVSTNVEIADNNTMIRGNKFLYDSVITNAWDTNIDNIWILENDFTDSTGLPIELDTGVGTPTNVIIRDNVGFITENWVTATITASTTVTFNHGLFSNADMVFASFNSTAVDGWTWTSTSTQVTITVTPTGYYTVYCYVVYKHY